MSLFDFDDFNSDEDDFFGEYEDPFKSTGWVSSMENDTTRYRRSLTARNLKKAVKLMKDKYKNKSIFEKYLEQINHYTKRMYTPSSSLFTFDLVTNPGFDSSFGELIHPKISCLSFYDYKRRELSKVKVGEELFSKIYLNYIKELVKNGYKPYQIVRILRKEDTLMGNRNIYSIVLPVYHAFKKSDRSYFKNSKFLSLIDTIIQTTKI